LIGLERAGGLTTGAITAVIARLERAGYARRVPDPSDRRRVLIEPTPKARAAGWELFGPLVEYVEPLMARYTNAQLELLIEFHVLGRETQERHAEMLRELLRKRTAQDAGVTASGRRRRETRTAPG
jgi:DNA-binding MarR family transcriptional regulator